MEMWSVFQTVNALLKDKKNTGLSYKYVNRYLLHMNRCLKLKYPRVRQVGKILLEERCKFPDTETCWHVSSDIVEFIFGKYKFRRSKDPLNGVTSYVLLLPLLTKMGVKSKPSQIDCKASLKHVFMKDFKNNLTENLAVKRKYKPTG
jgi:hypothetical protein